MGEAIRIGGAGGSEIGALPIEYEYTGASNVECSVVNVDGVDRLAWQLNLLTSGTLKIKRVATSILDIFLVGGGGGGGGSLDSGTDEAGGGGGGGGYTFTMTNISIALNTPYEIIIGAGGTGGAGYSGYAENGKTGTQGGMTSAFGFTANGGSGGNGGYRQSTKNNTYYNGGAGGNGGSGGGHGGGQGHDAVGTGQHTTTRAFGETSGKLYANGGNGGKGYFYVGGTTALGTKGGSNGSDGTETTGNSTSPAANTGGGGGGGNTFTSQQDRIGKNGASGIAILRGRYS